MDGEFREKIEELLVCTICFECLLQPRSLSCGHIFCHNCLLQYAVKSGWSVKCPTCRQEQVGIYSQECLSRLDAPLYIKQALDVIQRYRGGGRRSRSLTGESVGDLLENCFLGDEGGCWEDAFVTKKTVPASDETPYHQDMKQRVCLDYDEAKERRLDKSDHQLDDFNDQYVVDLPPEDGYTKADSSTGSGEAFILTQELTFDKIWGKLVKRVKSKKKAINKNLRGKFDKAEGGESQDVVDAGDARYFKAPPPRSNIDAFNVSSNSSGAGGGGRSNHFNRSSTEHNKQQKERQLPKHLVSASAMFTGGSAAAAAGYKPKYVPGSLSKRPVYGMMGQGLPLNGQFGRRRQRNQASSVSSTGAEGGNGMASSGCGGDSQEFQGAFGKTPGFMPPYCPARPKLVLRF